MAAADTGDKRPPFAVEAMGYRRPKHMFEMVEEDYYKVRSPPLAPPPEGSLLITRAPNGNVLKITRHEGESFLMTYSRDTPRLLVQNHGVPKERVDAVLTYLWNFCRIYVRMSPSWVPPEPRKLT